MLPDAPPDTEDVPQGDCVSEAVEEGHWDTVPLADAPREAVTDSDAVALVDTAPESVLQPLLDDDADRPAVADPDAQLEPRTVAHAVPVGETVAHAVELPLTQDETDALTAPELEPVTLGVVEMHAVALVVNAVDAHAETLELTVAEGEVLANVLEDPVALCVEVGD